MYVQINVLQFALVHIALDRHLSGHIMELFAVAYFSLVMMVMMMMMMMMVAVGKSNVWLPFHNTCSTVASLVILAGCLWPPAHWDLCRGKLMMMSVFAICSCR